MKIVKLVWVLLELWILLMAQWEAIDKRKLSRAIFFEMLVLLPILPALHSPVFSNSFFLLNFVRFVVVCRKIVVVVGTILS